MTVKKFRQLLKDIPDDALLLSSSEGFTLNVVSRGPDNNAFVEMMFTGTKSSSLTHIPIKKTINFPFSEILHDGKYTHG